MCNTIYSNNIDCLLREYPYLNDILINNIDNKVVDVIFEETKTENLNMILRYDDKSINVYSKYNPYRSVEKKLNNFNYNEEDIVIALGLGLGYELEYLINKPKNNKYVVYIPDRFVFNEILKNKDITHLINNEDLIFVFDWEVDRLKKIIKEKVLSVVEDKVQIKTIYREGYLEIFKTKLKKFIELLYENITSEQINQGTRLVFAKDWTQNSIKNIQIVRDSYSINSLKGFLKKKPGIIVAAGPSLNKNISFLKKAKDKAFIISVDTALKVLLKNDIKPDMVISIDGSIENTRKYENMKYDDIPLTYVLRIKNEILDNHSGKKFIYSTGKDLKKFFGNNIDYLASGGSVANAALSLLAYIDADPIVFVGQDLAFEKDKYHAEGTMYDDKSNYEGINRNIIYVDGINEEKVPTDTSLFEYLRWFEEAIEVLNDRTFIDATEGGAKIKGTKIMKLEDVIDRYCKINLNIDNKLEQIYNNDNFLLSKFASEQEIKSYLLKEKENLEEVEKSLKDAIKINKKIEKTLEEKGIIKQNLLWKLDNIDNDIKLKLEDVIYANDLLYIVRNNIATRLRSYVYKEEELSEKEKQQHIISNSKFLYDGLLEGVKLALELFEEI